MNMALMRVYQTLAMAVMCKDATQLESTWDLYLPQFNYMLAAIEAMIKAGFHDRRASHPISESAPFSCELGIIAPLFLVASRCRDPYIRRSAVALLLQSRRHEGRWDSIGAASVCEKIIEIEEEGLVVQKCHDVPEHRRIMSTLPKVSRAERKIEASFLIPAAFTEEGRWIQEVIHF